MKNELFYSLAALPEVAQNLAQQLKDYQVITLTGDLGAGKTTLVKQLLRNWNVHAEILSPTFTYVNCYKNDQGKKIYHFDLYRLSNLNQFLGLGFDEYLHEPNLICLIEWPQVIAPILENRPVCRLEIEHVSDEQRKLLVKI